ncbi:TetR/AcrR family transcriptional regulator [Phenylobacterium sp.]|jgi:AcrR family transcriptional regulator|uniref:TetR/AcrR family transcriptional regulator n=1 Tax=Phenylobacterium sp. TaxID=1871053 RepID=UPI002EDA8B78
MTRAPTRPAETDVADGRRRRGQDNRARIVAAMMEIVHAGDVAPSAEQVAARADVGLRTVFRHFQDMDSLYREIAAVVGAEVRTVFARPLTGETWQARLVERISRLALAYEKMAPYKRAADAFKHRSKFLGTDYAKLVQELREVLERDLPREFARDRVEALDLLLSFEAWARLRNEQGLTPRRAQAVVEAAVRTLIA